MLSSYYKFHATASIVIKGFFLKDLNNGVEGKEQGVEDDEDDDVIAAFGESVV